MKATQCLFTDDGELFITLSRPFPILPILFGQIVTEYRGYNVEASEWEWTTITDDKPVINNATIAYLNEAKKQFFKTMNINIE